MSRRPGVAWVARCAVPCLGVMVAAAPAGAWSADAFPDSIYSSGFEACAAYACAQVRCPGSGTTSVSGTVYAPNGTLPLPNVEVYVPNSAVGALATGPGGGRCDIAPSGHPLVATLTDASGQFTLGNMPVTANVPLVILAGKWRRQISVPSVSACTNTAMSAEQTRLPRDHTEGDVAHVAVVTGAGEALECLMRKFGVADSEFSTNTGSGRIHLYSGYGATNHFDLAHGGATFGDSSSFWSSSANLAAYDQVMVACGAVQNPANTIPQSALDAMRAYADAGGRIYLSHWQNYWLSAGASPWNTLASWNFSLGTGVDPLTASVYSGFPQGATLAAWLAAVGASTTPGQLSVVQPKQTAVGVDVSLTRYWLYSDSVPATGVSSIQYFSFTTPVDAPLSAQTGRVIFTDMHASPGDSSTTGTAFPSGGCTTSPSLLAEHEYALVYATFDLQRCVGSTRE